MGMMKDSFITFKISQVGKFTSASAVPGINRNTVHKEIVEIPDLESQRKIAAVLSAFDDKIDINQRINDNLEQQAQAFFQNYLLITLTLNGQ